jgi:eukaryotic-like serine/threonine-protein kinase
MLQPYDLAFLRGDKTEMERAVALCRGQPETETSIASYDALVLAYSGHLQQASGMSGRPAGLAQWTGQCDGAALFGTGATLWDAFFGNATAARQGAKDFLKLSKSRDVEYGAALALALSGDSAAQALADDLEKRFPEDTSVRTSYLPVLHALLALNHGEPSKAIEISGDTAKAKSAYADFLALSKDADPDILIFQQAKAEYSQLAN